MESINFDKNPNAKQKYGYLGLPWDQGDVGGTPGCRGGADATRPYIARVFNKIEDNNRLLDCENWELIDTSDLLVKDFGNVEDFKYYDFEYSINLFAERVKEMATEGCRPLVSGGDCGTNYAVVKGLHDSTEDNIGVIYMDAHPDIWQKIEKIGKYSHCSPVARINDLDRVKGSNIVHYGMRSYRGFDAQEDFDYMAENEITVLTYNNSVKMGIDETVDKMLSVVKRNTGKVALAMDIDVIEMAFAPGSSANEPCGPGAREIHEIVKMLAPHVDSFCISEVNPLIDVNDFAARRAARLFLDYIINNYKYNISK